MDFFTQFVRKDYILQIWWIQSSAQYFNILIPKIVWSSILEKVVGHQIPIQTLKFLPTLSTWVENHELPAYMYSQSSMKGAYAEERGPCMVKEKS